MSLLLGFMLQVASDPVAVASPSEPNPAIMTAWLSRFDCDLVDNEKRFYKLSVERLGGRGYWVNSNNPNKPGQRFVQRTPFFVKVLRDDTGKLSKFSALNGSDKSETNFYFRSNWDMLWLNGASPYVELGRGFAHLFIENVPSYTGHCTITQKSQLPLSDNETEFYDSHSRYDSLELKELKKLEESNIKP